MAHVIMLSMFWASPSLGGGGILLLFVYFMILKTVPFTLSSYWFNTYMGLYPHSWILALMTVLVVLSTLYASPLEGGSSKMKFLLLFASLVFFMANSLVMFYVLFEVSLLPISFLILAGGYQPERLKATFSMILYTAGASLPLFVCIILYKEMLCMDKFALFTVSPPASKNSALLILLGGMSAFLVKAPMYGVHSWLPKAHVEAPVEGSMILAAILLKLGGFGVLKMLFLFLNPAICDMLVFFSALGGLLTGLLCTRQTDMKVMIAYASVSHMALVISCFLTFGPWGVTAGMFIMVAHSFSSSWMFFMGNLIYLRTATRNLLLSKGLNSGLASMLQFWFLACAANSGGPPSMNLWAEILGASELLSYGAAMVFPLSSILFISVAYSLILFSSVSHLSGKYNFSKNKAPVTLSESLMSIFSALVINNGIFLFGFYI